MAQVKKRSEIEEAYKWDIEKFYPSDDAWEKEFDTIDADIDSLSVYAGTMSQGAAKVKEFLDMRFKAGDKLENLYNYAFLRKTEDSREEKAQSMLSRMESKWAKSAEAVAFFQPELLALDNDTLNEYVASEELADYRFLLEDIIREKEHTLSDKEEKLLAAMSEVAGAPSNISSMLMDADMTFASIKGEDGEETPVTSANYILLQSSTDQRVREDSFRSFYAGFKGHINAFTAAYAGSVKKDVFYAQSRKYDSARQMSLSSDNIPEAVYDSLVDTVRAHMPAMHRYVALRKKILGVDELHYYDVYAPLVADCELKYDFEEAKKMVLKAVAPLGEEYVSILSKGYEDRWVDALPNEGKPSGAYSSGSYGSMPYISMNFTGTLDSVSTLAHESGHSMHTYFSNRTQPYHYAGYTLFVAEVASTVNENLLIEQLLAKETDPKVRLYLLNQYLENFKGTVYRQTMFAEFEKKAHEMAERGEALSTQALCKMYEQLVKDYFGDELVMDEEVQYEWARIPHFYRAFYVYKYATGYSSAVALSEGILKDGEPAVKKYLEFLSMGGSKYPLDELKHGGVDLTTPAPVDAALNKFERILEEAEKCYEQIQNS